MKIAITKASAWTYLRDERSARRLQVFEAISKCLVLQRKTFRLAVIIKQKIRTQPVNFKELSGN